jgi:hypothetical protein
MFVASPLGEQLQSDQGFSVNLDWPVPEGNLGQIEFARVQSFQTTLA